MLNAWKQQCKQDGKLDVIELVHYATATKMSLEGRLTRIQCNMAPGPQDIENPAGIFWAGAAEQSKPPARHRCWVTQVWAHAALIYLSTVVSGWQPANAEVRQHIGQSIDVLTHHISSPLMLRALVWPFCVAGCLAESETEAQFRRLVESLHSRSVFGTVLKALDIMEKAWSDRDTSEIANRDLATCFRDQDQLILLV